jgi:hypothetical protein
MRRLAEIGRFFATCVRALLDGVTWCQVDQHGLNATRGDVRIRLVESGVCRDDHASKERQAMHDGAGRREVEHGCSQYVWLGRTGQSTEDGEDWRQQRRSVRADAVRILWCGNM